VRAAVFKPNRESAAFSQEHREKCCPIYSCDAYGQNIETIHLS
jgi:hypothetical protein